MAIVEISPPRISRPAPKLTVCITVLNDREECLRTIQSIRETAGDKVDIVVVDDHSQEPIKMEDRKVRMTRMIKRNGVAKCRDVAVKMAATPFVLLTDSHMRFAPDWYPNIMTRLGDPRVVWCGCTLGLSKGNMDLKKYRGAYYGARLVLYEPIEGGEDIIFEGKWIPEDKARQDYEISCMMGANYFLQKDTYQKLLGLGSLNQWGSDEPYLSTKVWLSGGEVRVAKDVRIGHMFRSISPYKNMYWAMRYNKLRSILELMDPQEFYFIKSLMPQDKPMNRTVRQIDADWESIMRKREYYKGVFVHDIDWLCDKFGLKRPLHYAHAHPSK